MLYTDKGILLRLNEEGVITRVFYNKIITVEEASGTDNKTLEGVLFLSLFHQHFLNRVFKFLSEIKTKSATFGWEMFLKNSTPDKPIHFSGASFNDKIYVMGSFLGVNVAKFLDGMNVINNEQVEKIRNLEKEKVHSNRRKPQENPIVFEELTRLNNELVNLQRELHKKNRELEETNKTKNRFIGMAAHDLRNPLGNIMNYCEFLEDDNGNFNKQQREFLTAINTISSFMLSLVNELLDVSAIEAGNIDLKKKNCDLINLIRRAINLNKPLAERKNMVINFDPGKELLPVFADESKIDQVITNLLTNAIKYSYPDKPINIVVSTTDNEVAVAVKDRGQLLTQEELKTLFRPFQKTSAVTTGGEKSVGLGLYIVKRIVDAHGGKIWAESEENVGSTFTLTLPLNRQDG